ncbi:MAG TPA: sugar ABC transporter permease [Candidatus Eisenbacteria bacterium]|nr:sugar ABC transporter permease [Candidatus Eisenbacteria bacterium]
MSGIESAQSRAGWWFASPALALIGLFFFVPVIAGLVLSLTDFDIYAIASPDTARFVGLANFAAIFRDPVFWIALRNTMFFVLVGGPLTVIVSLSAALLVNSKLARAPGFFRSLYFVPVVTTLVAMSVVFRYLYHPHYGLINHVLGLVGIGPIDWLGDPRWAMPAIVLLNVWKKFGYNMLILLAGLRAIPDDLYEAAALDGAGWWARLRNVTIPGLAPTLLFVSIMTMIEQFQLFAEPYVMTQGGPLKSTTSIVLLMYEEGFRWWRMGYAAAIAFVLFVIMLIATMVQLRIQRERA